MVINHFKLREQPFGVTPDPRFLYSSSTHREALASLLYGLRCGLGFVALTAQPGMGKTTLLFEVLHKLPELTKTVFLFQTVTTPAELFRAILVDLGATSIPENLVDMQTRLNEVLVAQSSKGRPLIVVIDEAQNLNHAVFEAVRMLSNFETSRHKLMQIILAGQPQLAEKLAMPELLQLRQRISIFAHLAPLSASDTVEYIHRRLAVAGHEGKDSLFTREALTLIARHSRGIPRNINNLCFNALSLACALKRKLIDTDIIREVVADLEIKGLDEFGHSVPMNMEFENASAHDVSRFEEIPLTAAAPIEVAPGIISTSVEFVPVDEPSPIEAAAPFFTAPMEVTPAFVPPSVEAIPVAVPSPKEESPVVTDSSSVFHATPIEAAPGFSTSQFEAEPVFASSRSARTDDALPAFLNEAAQKKDSIVGKFAAIAVCCGVAILFGWLGVHDYRAYFPAHPVGATVQPTIQAATPPAIVPQEHVDPPAVHQILKTRKMRVHRGETLCSLYTKVNGSCPPGSLAEILRFNPSIVHPYDLEVGQIVSIPVIPQQEPNPGERKHT
jgi:general secretion pathway protein A